MKTTKQRNRKGDKLKHFEGVMGFLLAYLEGCPESPIFARFIKELKKLKDAEELIFAYWNYYQVRNLMQEFDSDGDEGEIGDLFGQALENWLE